MLRSIYTLVLSTLFISFLAGQSKSGTRAIISTKYGEIEILLYDETPKHQQNFIKLAEEGYYNGQLFHRVIKNFMIQGGDPNSKGAAKGEMLGLGGPGHMVPAEFREDFYHKKGALAAARKGDAVNPEKSSSGSQFYIVQGQVFTESQLTAMVSMGKHREFTPEEILTYTTIGGSPHLDGSYTVFGEVVRGLEVIDSIAAQPVDAYNRPFEDINYQVKIIK